MEILLLLQNVDEKVENMDDLEDVGAATVRTSKGTVIHADLVFKTIGLPVNKEAYEKSLGKSKKITYMSNQI